MEWLRKQIAKFRANRRAKKQVKKLKKLAKLQQQTFEEPPYVERDYLAEWNREHPEEFMDLRLRTIEDEMADRAAANASGPQDAHTEVETPSEDVKIPCKRPARSASALLKPQSLPLDRIFDLGLRKTRDFILAPIVDHRDLGYTCHYNTIFGLEIMTGNHGLYKPYEDLPVFGNKAVVRSFSSRI